MTAFYRTASTRATHQLSLKGTTAPGQAIANECVRTGERRWPAAPALAICQFTQAEQQRAGAVAHAEYGRNMSLQQCIQPCKSGLPPKQLQAMTAIGQGCAQTVLRSDVSIESRA